MIAFVITLVNCTFSAIGVGFESFHIKLNKFNQPFSVEP